MLLVIVIVHRCRLLRPIYTLTQTHIGPTWSIHAQCTHIHAMKVITFLDWKLCWRRCCRPMIQRRRRDLFDDYDSVSFLQLLSQRVINNRETRLSPIKNRNAVKAPNVIGVAYFMAYVNYCCLVDYNIKTKDLLEWKILIRIRPIMDCNRWKIYEK